MLMLPSHLPGAANRLVHVSLIDSPCIFSSCKLCGCRRRSHGGPVGFPSAGVPGCLNSRPRRFGTCILCLVLLCPAWPQELVAGKARYRPQQAQQGLPVPAPCLSFPTAQPHPCFASVPLFPLTSKPKQACCSWLCFRGLQ